MPLPNRTRPHPIRTTSPDGRWFHDELTEALTTGALGDAMWSGTIGPPIDGTGAEAQRRRLWHVLFSGEKFPTG